MKYLKKRRIVRDRISRECSSFCSRNSDRKNELAAVTLLFYAISKYTDTDMPVNSSNCQLNFDECVHMCASCTTCFYILYRGIPRESSLSHRQRIENVANSLIRHLIAYSLSHFDVLTRTDRGSFNSTLSDASCHRLQRKLGNR